MSNFYVHYNLETRRAECITSHDNAQSHLIAIPVNEEFATLILVDNHNLNDYVFAIVDKEWVWEKRIDTSLLPVNRMAVRQLIEIIKSDTAADAVFTINSNSVSLHINKESLLHCLNDIAIFYITRKNDPIALVKCLEFPINLDGIENDFHATINTDADYRNCSVFTIKKFISYTLELS